MNSGESNRAHISLSRYDGLMIYTLSPTDAQSAAFIGMRRQIVALARNSRDYYEQSLPGFDGHILSAMGEFIVARLLNLFWEPHVGNTGHPDVGGVVEVRVRRPEIGRDLSVRTRDIDTRPIVLLLYVGGLNFDVQGWEFVREVKARGEWNETCHCWFLRAPFRPIEDLIAEFADSRMRIVSLWECADKNT